jgi:DnaK suppressor protein
MDKRRREQYRRKLEQKREDLEALVSRMAEAGRTADVAAPEDTGEHAASSYAKEFLFRQSDSERETLYLVEKAITRTASTDFGRCQSCDEPIDPKRLDAVPWARYCRSCQEAEENQELLDTDL